MDVDDLLENLRRQPFYNGQILRVQAKAGRPAQTAPLQVLLDRVPRLAGGSAASILSVLGRHDVHAELIGALSQVFPTPGPEKPQPREDCVLISPFSQVRELFWQLVAILDALDEGRTSLVVTMTSAKAVAADQQIGEILRAADVRYAIDVARLAAEADFSVFDQRSPRVISCSLEMLRTLLCDSRHASTRDRVFNGLGRVVVPVLDTCSAPMASNLAHLMRQLHVECAERGLTPSLIGTAQPEGGAGGGSVGLSLKTFVTAIWGRFLEDESFVRADSVEAPPMTLVGYTGGLIRNTQNPDEWIRQDIGKVASDLLGWLVGEFKARPQGKIELHYVLDVSGSMTGSLPAVQAAILNDLRLKLDAAALRDDDQVKLTVFEADARTVFDRPARAASDGELAAAMAAVEGGGMTDIPAGLGAALRSALADEAANVHIVLFSDGGSSVSSEQRRELVRAVTTAQAQGRSVELLYVVLDMDPPLEVKNLVIAMGGKIIKRSTVDLERSTSIDDTEDGGTVVLLSGEAGIPARAVQAHRAGLRPLLFARHAWEVPPLVGGVSAVVVSGRFGNRSAILNEVRHLGRKPFPVFVLIEPDAWSRLMIEDYPEAASLGRLPFARPSNEHVRKQRLADYVSRGEREDFIFRYLLDGPPAYEEMLAGLRARDTATDVRHQPLDLPQDYELVERGRRRYVRHKAQPDSSIAPLDTFTRARIRLEGGGVRTFRDADLIPLLYHSGSLVDDEQDSAEVDDSSSGTGWVGLRDRSWDRTVPILENVHVHRLAAEEFEKSASDIQGLGQLCWGPVQFQAGCVGMRVFERANLDDRSRDERYGASKSVQLETVGLCWTPTGADAALVAGLANLIQLALPAVLSHSGEVALVVPEASSVWIIDLAPGGNGVADRFATDRGLLPGLLRLAGRAALECPCEGGFAGSSDGDTDQPSDTGCPRCTRVVGPVLSSVAEAAPQSIQKKALLQWLLAHGHLPASAPLHLREKYDGINEANRMCGEDVGSRRGCMKAARHIFSDRLGISIEDADLASFAWLTDAEAEKYLGLYSSGSNRLAIKKNLTEWRALDVTAHELFHNLQYMVPDLFDHKTVGHAADPKLPFDGKIFIEGAAMWGESHVVDALAIRSALTLANLRQGDEYGEGFKALKYLEEHHGGVDAVMSFLSTGDIEKATRGRLRSLSALYAAAGVTVGS